MSEINSNNQNRLQDMLIGAVIGAVLIWILFGRQGNQQASISAQIPYQQMHMMQNRIEELEYQLQHFKLTQNPTGIHGADNIQNGNYKNDEKWEITRDKEGYLTSIRVIRDAKIRST